MINVTLPNGLPLVQGVMSFSLDYEITPHDTVAMLWQGPGGVVEDITADLAGGKLTGLVKGRDEIIPRHQESLDQLARDLIAAINGQHSQGVGLEFFSTVTGTYAVNVPTDPLNAGGLPFGDRLTPGAFEMHVDRDGAHLATGAISVTPAMTLNDVVNAINADPNIGGLVTASVDGSRLHLAANLPSDSFGFANDTSNLLLSLGVNTLFTGDKAYTLDVNAWVLDHPEYLATGRIDATGAHAVGDNRNALALADLEDAPATGSGQTLGEGLTRMITDLGLEAEQAGNNVQFFQGLVDQLTQMRDAVSGVSLDE